mmetsp:Transcript_85635/g.276413  ORF Transcript_85635/g.276413 Transcript_85635/m.276413 type:complete len:305 (+) Transcript_85635:820-1734(+)
MPVSSTCESGNTTCCNWASVMLTNGSLRSGTRFLLGECWRYFWRPCLDVVLAAESESVNNLCPRRSLWSPPHLMSSFSISSSCRKRERPAVVFKGVRESAKFPRTLALNLERVSRVVSAFRLCNLRRCSPTAMSSSRTVSNQPLKSCSFCRAPRPKPSLLSPPSMKGCAKARCSRRRDVVEADLPTSFFGCATTASAKACQLGRSAAEGASASARLLAYSPSQVSVVPVSPSRRARRQWPACVPGLRRKVRDDGRNPKAAAVAAGVAARTRKAEPEPCQQRCLLLLLLLLLVPPHSAISGIAKR